jgi:hypothetical protein
VVWQLVPDGPSFGQKRHQSGKVVYLQINAEILRPARCRSEVASDRATSSGDFSSASVEACLGNLDWMLTPVLLLWPHQFGPDLAGGAKHRR